MTITGHSLTSETNLEFVAYNRTEQDVAKLCGCSVQTLRRKRYEGGGPRFKKFNALVRYSLKDVFEWMEAQPTGGGQ